MITTFSRVSSDNGFNKNYQEMGRFKRNNLDFKSIQTHYINYNKDLSSFYLSNPSSLEELDFYLRNDKRLIALSKVLVNSEGTGINPKYPKSSNGFDFFKGLLPAVYMGNIKKHYVYNKIKDKYTTTTEIIDNDELLLQIDIDLKKEHLEGKSVIDYFNILKSDPYFIHLFISPSFKGLKGIIRLKNDDNDLRTNIMDNKYYKAYVRQYIDYLNDTYFSNDITIEMDDRVSAKHACYIFHSNYMMYNNNSKDFKIDLNAISITNKVSVNSVKSSSVVVNYSNYDELSEDMFIDYPKYELDDFFYRSVFSFYDNKEELDNYDIKKENKNGQPIIGCFYHICGNHRVKYDKVIEYLKNKNYFYFRDILCKVDYDYINKENRIDNDFYFENNYFQTFGSMVPEDQIEEVRRTLRTDFYDTDKTDYKNITDTIDLTSNEYMTDKSIEINNIIDKNSQNGFNTIIYGQPGLGKTRFIIEDSIRKIEGGKKVIIVSSLNAILEQTYNDLIKYNPNLNISLYIEELNTFNHDDDIILISPDKFANYFYYIKHNSLDYNNYFLYLDEWHNFITSMDWRKIYNNIYDFINYFNNKLSLSATLPVLRNSSFSNDKVLQINKPKKIEISYQRVFISKKKRHNFLQYIVKNKREDELLVYYFNSKSEIRLEEIKKNFPSDYKYEVLNADFKDSNVYKDIMLNKTLYDDIITTKVISEGVNIEQSKSHIKIIFLSNGDINEIEQFSQRFRNAKTIQIIDLFSTKYINDSFNKEDIKNHFKNNNFYNVKGFNDNRIKELTEKIKNYMIIGATALNKVDENELVYRNGIFEIKTNYLDHVLNKNYFEHLYFSNRLKEYLSSIKIQWLEPIIFSAESLFEDKIEEPTDLKELKKSLTNKIANVKKRIKRNPENQEDLELLNSLLLERSEYEEKIKKIKDEIKERNNSLKKNRLDKVYLDNYKNLLNDFIDNEIIPEINKSFENISFKDISEHILDNMKRKETDEIIEDLEMSKKGIAIFLNKLYSNLSGNNFMNRDRIKKIYPDFCYRKFFNDVINYIRNNGFDYKKIGKIIEIIKNRITFIYIKNNLSSSDELFSKKILEVLKYKEKNPNDLIIFNHGEYKLKDISNNTGKKIKLYNIKYFKDLFDLSNKNIKMKKDIHSLFDNLFETFFNFETVDNRFYINGIRKRVKLLKDFNSFNFISDYFNLLDYNLGFYEEIETLEEIEEIETVEEVEVVEKSNNTKIELNRLELDIKNDFIVETNENYFIDENNNIRLK